MRWTRVASQRARSARTNDANADGEGVWSWRPDAGAKFLRSKLLRDDGGKRARSPGRARRKPLKPSRREGRMIRPHLWLCRVLPFMHAERGCALAPAVP